MMKRRETGYWSTILRNFTDFEGKKNFMILKAIETLLAEPSAPRTPDMGGNATTAELGQAAVDSL